MKKRNLAVKLCLAVSAFALCLGGCGDEEVPEDEEVEQEEEEDDDEDDDEDTSNASSGNSGAVPVRSGNLTPSSLTVDRYTGAMNITRPEVPGIPMGDEGTWTIFVYLCGADLESDGGMGTGDLEEMLNADASDDVRFVVQTGGASDWQNGMVDADSMQRFVVEDNELVEVYNGDEANMADSATLADFLGWGVENYPAEHMGVIFWDHGSGSINGVCFDELNDDRSLLLRDIDSALYTVFDQQGMTDKFEFIGFDACLMGTIETANILAPYARYMYGSEETEPGYGWDYTEIGDFLASDPYANGAELGEVVCDSFYDACAEIGAEDEATLAVIDLEALDDLLISFNNFAKDMYESGSDSSALAGMVRRIESADNFGGNNRTEGYTNMVDLYGIVEACAPYSSNAQDVIDALNRTVIYNRVGADHPDACGLAMYYPLCVQGSMELTIFQDVCVSPYYLSFVDRQDYGSVYVDESYGSYDSGEGDEGDYYYDEENGLYYFEEDGTYYCYDENEECYYYYDEDDEEWYELDEDEEEYDYSDYDYYDDSYDSDDDYSCDWYSDDCWYDEDDCWSSCGNYEYDDSYGCYRSRSVSTDHWDYADDYEMTGESRRITFAEAPSLDENGTFSFTLDQRGIDNAALVYGYVFEIMEDENDILLLGETYDIYGDWESGHFEDGFDGYWLSLPDGQNLSTFIVDYGEDYIIYTSPVYLNGEETNLRLRQDLNDYSVVVEGIWDGIDENGSSDRSYKTINEGDEIIPIYYSYTFDENMEEGEYNGVAYYADAEIEIAYGWLDAADYLYSFCIDDIYNDYYMSDMVMFNVDEAGDLWFYEFED